MTSGRWRTAFASIVGTSHLKNGTPCQDASACSVIEGADGGEILVAAASDGAGTACRSETGAALAVDLFMQAFGEAARTDPSLAVIDRSFVERWITSFQDTIRQLAADEGQQVRDYASTLLGAVVAHSQAAYVQIGDGAIIVGADEPGEYSWIAWPQHGEYANVTNFLTQDDAHKVLFFETGAAVRQIALFTDGIERLVLNFSARTVHAPAFRPIFEWLAQTLPGAGVQSSEALAAYLGSEQVNQRTDDDKTLVMAAQLGSNGSS